MTDSPDPKCGSLAAALPGKVYNQHQSEYDRLVNARWSETAVLHPACVVVPEHSKDVSAALKALVRHGCKFAVKSGGHNANPGANSISKGVSVDLSRLNLTSLAADRSHVKLGSGVTWGQAYDAFDGTGIGFPGGICEDVGVGGVSLGGGQSLFQPKKGWAVDNIVNYEVVLASGEIVNANETHHTDLFRALKGGNTNFGIVTRVDIAAFDYPGLWGGEVYVNLTGPEATGPVVLDRMSATFVNFTRDNHLDTSTAVQLMTVYLSGGRGRIINAAFGNTENKESPKALAPFFAMPNRIMNTARHTSMAKFVHQVSKFQAKGFRQVTATLTFRNDYKTLRRIWDATDDIYNGLERKNEVDWMISFIPQPKIQQSYAAARGGNSLGLQDVAQDQIILWLTSRWTDPRLDNMMEKARGELVETTSAIAKQDGSYHPFLYINYAAPFQQPLCGYGAASLANLRAVAKKYDPAQVFQKLMPGGFKLQRAACT
ncbi:FAD-binding, type 2 [Metarhizium album ARSEF 1941]|uniref:FAD-binding, type 2 n=1 Tax=Metarhizium album (strain ARSEF 1941) TaxID=1081103 RepID=A0A0B2WJJ3_METAS|nr:FAD-binding, type 2 [Metarhizium album ARSEF 1941]KHN94103.1 FAD-binding, type 2 [Metarhizium album ARSEF 1941]